jgi:hypothetical protein
MGGLPGNHMVTLADAAYPQALLEIADPPTLLYVKGAFDLLNGAHWPSSVPAMPPHRARSMQNSSRANCRVEA